MTILINFNLTIRYFCYFCFFIKMKILFTCSIILFLFATNLFSQRAPREEPIINYTITGVKGNVIDTLAFQTAQRIVKETEGLVETEIDPKEYILGPQDVLLVSIVSAQPQELEIEVSPEGKVSIPGIGIIDVKNKSLAEAAKLIEAKVKSYLKIGEVGVTLKSIKKFKVTISGAVQKNAIIAATGTDRVSEIIDKAGGFKDKASIRNILLYRNEGKEVIRVDLLRYFLLKEKKANPYVRGGDHIVVPYVSENEYIQIDGEVRRPGKYEFVPGDSLSTLVRFAQGFNEIAFLDTVEFVRMIGPNKFVTSYLNLTLWKDRVNILGEQLPGDFPLQLSDRIFIRKIPFWKKPMNVTIEGEVVYPGKYPIDEKEIRLHDLLVKCGGFKETADIDKAQFIRQSLFDITDPEMERLSRIPPSEMSKNEYRYFQSRITERKGLLSINFRNVLNNPNSTDNVVLMDKDSIFVPKRNEFVNVQGRVNNPGLVSYNPNFTYLDYINLAGGFGFRADESATLVVKSKGEQFLAKRMNYKIEPGDNILVPPQEELTLWEIFTTGLTITTQLLTIAGVIITIVRLQ